MSNLIEWIELGVSSPDPQIRTLNEEKLLKYRETNPEEFLSICLEGYKDNNNKPTVRQAIATIFGMTIAQVVTQGEQQGPAWWVFPENFRNLVKETCLSQLISNQP